MYSAKFKHAEQACVYPKLIELMGISGEQKEAIRDSCLKGVGENMNVIEFQAMTGLEVCQEIIGNDFETAEEVIKTTQGSPDMWLPKLKEIKYFNQFIMNIAKKLGGMKQ